MQLNKSMDKDVCTLAINGRLTGCEEAEALYEEFKKMREEKISKVVLDLQELEWLGSMGLGALIGCLTSIRNVNGDMRLANPNEKVAHLLHITRLDSIFKVYGNLNDAKSSFKEYI
jgi:anti-sigma B factor antagonist